MSNVHKFPTIIENMSVEQALNEAKSAGLQHCAIIGWADEHSEAVVITSKMTNKDLLWMLRAVEKGI